MLLSHDILKIVPILSGNHFETCTLFSVYCEPVCVAFWLYQPKCPGLGQADQHAPWMPLFVANLSSSSWRCSVVIHWLQATLICFLLILILTAPDCHVWMWHQIMEDGLRPNIVVDKLIINFINATEDEVCKDSRPWVVRMHYIVIKMLDWSK